MFTLLPHEGLAPSSKGLVKQFKWFHLLIHIGLLVGQPMSLGFWVSKCSQSMDGSNILRVAWFAFSFLWELLPSLGPETKIEVYLLMYKF